MYFVALSSECSADLFRRDYAIPDAQTTDFITENLNKGKVIGTRCNYLPLIRDFLGYCIENGVDSRGEVLPMPAIYWQWNRTRRLGSCNSSDSWSAALSWWCDLNWIEPKFYKNRIYQHLKSIMVKNFSVPRKVRKPSEIRWLDRFARFLNCTPKTWKYCNLDLLGKILALLLFFFSVSRPSEVLFTDKTENLLIGKITTGLKFGDVTIVRDVKNPTLSCLHLIIRHYKNQEFRDVPKHIYMQSPICTNENHFCQTLDFFRMWEIYHQRRCARSDDLQLKLDRGHYENYSERQVKLITNQLVRPDNFVFVDANGVIWTPKIFDELVSNLVDCVGENNQYFTSYSIKIGSSSVCNQQGIDLLKVLRYVQWSVKSLPHVVGRYISFKRAELAMIPFEMCHGKNGGGSGGKCIDKSGNKLITFNLWEKSAVARRFLSEQFPKLPSSS